MRSPAALLLAVPLLGALGPERARAEGIPDWLRGELSTSAGLDYSTGDYGDPEDTDIWYAPFTLAYLFDDAPTPYRNDQLELKVTVPYVRVSGPFPIDGGRPADSADDGTGSGSGGGLGDILIRGTYIVFPPRRESPLPALELSGRVKIPTADDNDNLGTGEPDYTIQLDAYRKVWRLVPFGTIGYRFAAQSGEFDLRDYLFASVGASARLASWLSAGLIYDWRDAASKNTRDSHEISPYASIRIRPDLSLNPYGVVGLSNGSPDYGLGVVLRARVAFR